MCPVSNAGPTVLRVRQPRPRNGNVRVDHRRATPGNLNSPDSFISARSDDPGELGGGHAIGSGCRNSFHPAP